MVISVISLKLTKCCMLLAVKRFMWWMLSRKKSSIYVRNKAREREGKRAYQASTHLQQPTHHLSFVKNHRAIVSVQFYKCQIVAITIHIKTRYIVQSIINPRYTVLSVNQPRPRWDCSLSLLFRLSDDIVQNNIHTAEQSTERYPCSLYHHLWSPNLQLLKSCSDIQQSRGKLPEQKRNDTHFERFELLQLQNSSFKNGRGM